MIIIPTAGTGVWRPSTAAITGMGEHMYAYACTKNSERPNTQRVVGAEEMKVRV